MGDHRLQVRAVRETGRLAEPAHDTGHPFTEPHALDDFDREVDAIRQILGAKKVMSVDELRRGIEAIPEDAYHRLGYYRRWIRSIAFNLLDKGVISDAELADALGKR